MTKAAGLDAKHQIKQKQKNTIVMDGRKRIRKFL